MEVAERSAIAVRPTESGLFYIEEDHVQLWKGVGVGWRLFERREGFPDPGRAEIKSWYRVLVLAAFVVRSVALLVKEERSSSWRESTKLCHSFNFTVPAIIQTSPCIGECRL